MESTTKKAQIRLSRRAPGYMRVTLLSNHFGGDERSSTF